MRTDIPLYDVPHIDSVQDMLLGSARRYQNKLALEDLSETPISRVTYVELLENVLRFGTALKSLGIKERDHVAVIGENRIQWAISYLTAMAFNFVVVPVDKNLGTNEILNILHESDATAVIFSETYAPVFREKRGTLKHIRHYISMDLRKQEDGFHSMVELINRAPATETAKLPSINPDELAVIIFTSGTLGRAKGVMLSQRNIASNLSDMVSYFGIYPEDRFLSVLPIHHTYECTCGMLCPLYGGSSVTYARSLKTIVEDMQKAKPTIFLAVPLLYDKMFKAIYRGIKEKKMVARIIGPMIKATDLLSKVGWKNSKKVVFREIHHKFGGSVRCFIAGGAAPDPLVAKGLREFGFGFVQGYGLTETAPILTLNRLEDFKDDSAGTPLPHVQIRIANPDSSGVGEVYAKAPNVMLGYYKNEKATRETFDGDWFKTGDIGLIDKDGFLHISGRKKNVIISKAGENVFPEEIEDVLNRSHFIMESMVYGEKHEKEGEIIAAQIVVDAESFIELSESKGVPITPELLNEVIDDEVRKVNRELPIFKQIKKFTVRDEEFQKTTTQKIKRFTVQTEEQ
ncbi:MAG TPA: AMP-binding protein [Candidatus Kryptobacter bacterium]|nr:MAG: AMP-dependent synthetase [Ignavibacteriae bacterium 37-53-5]HQT90524.1 AMP-binding protein [Candidatus Kryptobacter bacterium]